MKKIQVLGFNLEYNWELDIDLGTSKKISRQHAAILYNFELEW